MDHLLIGIRGRVSIIPQPGGEQWVKHGRTNRSIAQGRHALDVKISEIRPGLQVGDMTRTSGVRSQWMGYKRVILMTVSGFMPLVSI